MKDDTISKQAALDVLHEYFDGMLETDTVCPKDLYNEIEALPSAQSGWITDVNDILAYINDVVHPLVSPENWNVYSELHDMISALPSTQPREDIRAMCGECDAWNQYKNYPQLRWIPVTERLPEDFTDVLVCLHDIRCGCEDKYYITSAYTERGYWDMTLDTEICDLKVVAWMPLPPKWEGGQE